jgi:hypothetical protein
MLGPVLVGNAMGPDDERLYSFANARLSVRWTRAPCGARALPRLCRSRRAAAHMLRDTCSHVGWPHLQWSAGALPDAAVAHSSS